MSEITEALNLAATTANVVGDVWRERLSAMTVERDELQAQITQIRRNGYTDSDCRDYCSQLREERQQTAAMTAERDELLFRIERFNDAELSFVEELKSITQERDDLKNIISGKTFYDVQQQTASRCAEICDKEITAGRKFNLPHFGLCAGKIADAIRKEFNLDIKEPK